VAVVVSTGLTGCVSSPTTDGAATKKVFAPLRAALVAYDSAGFLAGPPDFPVVGRPFVLSGPGDSVYLGFAASLPPSALRFARDGDLVSARYQVILRVRSGADTLVRVERREVVRLTDFDEASSREPRIVFQRFIPVPSGRLQLDVTVRELTARSEAERTFDVDARQGLSQPLLAYRAEPRTSRREPPSLLVSPRSVAYATQSLPIVWIEDGGEEPEIVVLHIFHEGNEAWQDTLRLSFPPVGAGDVAGPDVVSGMTALPVHLLPPGEATLRVERLSDGTASAAPLYIGLGPEWVFPTWEASLEHLEYALDADTLEQWTAAPSEEHAVLWKRFQDRTDPDPETPANEFLARYLDRMNRANDRFDEPGRAGWETDRGEVLVKLGEPDRQRFIPPERRGEVPRIEWEYGESVPEPALIVFEDTSDFGVYVMTPRSRAVLRRVVAEVAAAEAEATGRSVPRSRGG
jgi:GWxTD domain-containing protein